MRRTPNRHIHAGLFAAGVIWLIALAVAPVVLDETQTPGDAAGARAPLNPASGPAEASAPIRSEPAPGEAAHEPLTAPAGDAGDIDAIDAATGGSGSASGAADTDAAGSGSVVATGWAPGAFHGIGSGGSSAATTATGGGAPSVGGSGGPGIGGPVGGGGGGASAPGGVSGPSSGGLPGGPGGGSGGSGDSPTQTDPGQAGAPAPGNSNPSTSAPGGGSGGSGGTPTQTATGPAPPSTTSPNSGPGDAGGTPPPSNVISGTDPVDGDLIVGPGQTHSPGNSPGQQTVSGDYVLDGIFEAELGGTEAGTEYDQIVAEGAAILNGTIDVRLIDDFMPETGDIFDIIIASSFSFGDDFEIFFPDLTGDLFLGYSLFDLDDERTAFRLTTHEELVQTASASSGPGIAQTTPIPEPSTLLVLSLGVGLAAVGLVAIRRRPAF